MPFAVETPEAKLAGHPAADRLLPMARAAVEIAGICPEVVTLETWLRNGWTLERVRHGLAGAKQAAAGQNLPAGRVITSAQTWMQRARPEDYAQSPPTLRLVRRAEPEVVERIPSAVIDEIFAAIR